MKKCQPNALKAGSEPMNSEIATPSSSANTISAAARVMMRKPESAVLIRARARSGALASTVIVSIAVAVIAAPCPRASLAVALLLLDVLGPHRLHLLDDIGRHRNVIERLGLVAAVLVAPSEELQRGVGGCDVDWLLVHQDEGS